MLPLEEVTIISIEQAVAAPFATRQLADLGARVIKIERPDVGDFARGYDETVKGMASHFVWLNRSKESLTLDLKHPQARQIIQQLLGDADVFIQNLAPGAAERLGLGSEQLNQRYPRLIVCNVSGYGPSGPYRDKKAYDLLVQCETGLVSVTGTPDTPSKVGISIADTAAGMYAFTGILTALYRRERTRKGTVLEISMFEALGEWMGYAAYYAVYGGTPPPRTGASHATIVPYGPFRAGDGKQVNLGLQNEREWAQFCTLVLKQPEMASDPRFDSNARRVGNREALHAMIDAVFSQLTIDQIPGTLVHEVVREQARTSGMLRLGHPSGVMDLSASVHKEGESWYVEKASAARTARRLMEGDIYIPSWLQGKRRQVVATPPNARDGNRKVSFNAFTGR